MTESAGAASFPVVFFDGEREIEIGTVAVHPSLGFKKFQALISQKIGISPHQISVSLVRRKKARSTPDIRRKVPIDEASDFSVLSRERDCFVLAVLKRSRRERRGRPRQGHLGGGGGGESEKKVGPPEKTILRRIPAEYGLDSSIGSLKPVVLGLGLGDYEGQLRNLQRQRERYLMSTTGAYYPYTLSGNLRRGAAAARGGPVVCEECSASKGRPVPFHWCVYDAVTVGFRSPVGPIQRPTKGGHMPHIEASA